MAKESFYFSHDLGARNDPKLQKVLMKLGQAGKGVYWDIIEMLYEEGGYLNLSECESYAFSLRVDEITINSLVNDFGLFEKDDERFWSNSVLKRLGKRGDKSQKAQNSAYSKWGIAGDTSSKTRSERLAEARKKGTHTSVEWNNMLTFFKKQCVRCGSEDKIVKDHIVPIYQGGSDAISNIQPLCQKCNSSKGSENIDQRPGWCLRNACEMPANACEMPAIKERKGKDIKEIKENSNNIVGLPAATTTGVVSFEGRCVKFIDRFNNIRSTKYQVTDDVKKKLKARLQKYHPDQILSALGTAIKDDFHKENNFKYLTPSYILREEIIERYLNMVLVPTQPGVPIKSQVQKIDHSSTLPTPRNR